MKKYKVISFDMFQTLVDVNKRIPEIWKGVLESEYTKEKGEAGAKAIMSHLHSAYIRSVHPFRSMEEMYMECAASAIKDTGYEVTPEKVAYNLMYQHGYAPFYEETLSTIQKLCKEYTVVISSDSNHLMVDPILEKCKVEKAFISDDLGCYKGDTSGKFFEEVVSKLEARPEEILHIGDSWADVIGANSVNMHSCWLSRDHKEWTREERPDYIIHNLNEIFDLL